MAMNPVIALIGGISLAIMFGFPFIKNPVLKMIPAPMMVLLVAVPLGMYFDIGTEQIVAFAGQDAALGPHYLVDVPDNMFTALTFPDFSGVLTSTGITYIVMFSLIGSVESLLSAKAVDQIDPWRRKTNMDKDLLAVGLGNTAAAFMQLRGHVMVGNSEVRINTPRLTTRNTQAFERLRRSHLVD